MKTKHIIMTLAAAVAARRRATQSQRGAEGADQSGVAHEPLQALRQGFQPRFALIIASAQQNVSAVLTPEQRERFEQFKKDTRPYWRAGRVRRGGGSDCQTVRT